MNLSNELELSETFRNIIEVNERLLNLNNIELAELRNHLSKRYQVLMQTVIENAPKPLNPKSDEFKALKLRTVDDDNYNSFLIKHFILKYLRLCRSNNLELKSFNLKTFDDIGNNVSQNLNEKFNAIERAYME